MNILCWLLIAPPIAVVEVAAVWLAVVLLFEIKDMWKGLWK